mmetsp:Transcript_39175/g.92195  ORF Transcript_39175/g.92195 Transcript_39175/m.92195 type:complete len:471 (-) Transcript_39175:132-1544(-)|eukprot:CAMPEP_0178411240 /NCGR_PEP_ID=MMETSP0689_2-20121128/21392_1 /TAXON_ID=160604 /ORGANISM="Amphidinium massartii, Strain CS-259" /LENGTH=470 /DNA_ID=CAMNT_0020032439 /DNA_START=82 /DNA_END=1494 /DNA_ORIENTATION=-
MAEAEEGFTFPAKLQSPSAQTEASTAASSAEMTPLGCGSQEKGGCASGPTEPSTAASSSEMAPLRSGSKEKGGRAIKRTKNIMRLQHVVTELCLRGIATRTPMGSFTSVSYGGGGARGIHFLGVEMALQFTGAKQNVKHLSGTSIGALFAFLSSLDLTIQQLQDMFQKFSQRLNCVQAALRLWRLPIYGYLFETIDDYLKEGLGDKFDITFKQLHDLNGRELTLYAYDLEQFELVDYSVHTAPDMRIVDAVYCSAALPHVLPPRHHEGRRIIDGGIQHNVPIEENGVAFELYLDRTGIPVVDAGIAIFRNLGGACENVVKLNVCRMCYNVLFYRPLTMDEIKRITFETCREVLNSFAYHSIHGRFRRHPPAHTRARVYDVFKMLPKLNDQKRIRDAPRMSVSDLLSFQRPSLRPNGDTTPKSGWFGRFSRSWSQVDDNIEEKVEEKMEEDVQEKTEEKTEEIAEEKIEKK